MAKHPHVYNLHHSAAPKGAVYVGRPSVWGNPFVIGKDGNRAEVIKKFRVWVYRPQQKQLRELARKELRGQNLSCWCVPDDCHAYIWIEIANGD